MHLMTSGMQSRLFSQAGELLARTANPLENSTTLRGMSIWLVGVVELDDPDTVVEEMDVVAHTQSWAKVLAHSLVGENLDVGPYRLEIRKKF